MKEKDLINNTNAHMAVDDLLESEIISLETRQRLLKIKETLEAESRELLQKHQADDSDDSSHAAD